MRLVLGESLAEAGDEAAVAEAEALRAMHPTFGIEADAILARLRFRQGKADEAVALLEKAWSAYRHDPWPLVEPMSRTLALATEIGHGDKARGERLWRALAEPFSVHLMQTERLQTRIDLARRIDFPRLCKESLEAIHPWPWWRRDFLTDRAGCLQHVGDPRAAAAEADLRAFMAAEPVPFAAGLPPAGPPTPAPTP
jgi:hypothetical protein